MPSLFTRFVQVGRVVKINQGELKGKLGVVVDIVDSNRVIVDGPTTGVARQVINLKRVALTDHVISIRRGARTPKVEKAVKEYDLTAKWESGPSFKAATAQAARANMNDFDRFKAMIARKQRSYAIRVEMAKLKKAKK